MTPAPDTPQGQDGVSREKPECPTSPSGKHVYREVESNWDWEKYCCVHCGDTYKIYEEDLK